MIRSITRAAFALALVASVLPSFILPARAVSPLLEIENRTKFDLRFTIGPVGSPTPARYTLTPGKFWSYDQPGTVYLTGELLGGAPGERDLKLGEIMLLMKASDTKVAHLLAVDDPIAKKLRWFVYYR